jgi:1,4-alpha-glucan branching enzyme
MAVKRSARPTKAKTEVVIKKVPFEFPAPEAREIFLVGDFNNWDTSANLMKKDKTGIWKATVSLRPGRYEYRFLVDGNWANDPSCCDCVPNEFGSENCVKIVE